MTTYANFIANLGDLTITGVNRLYNEPPLSLNTADLPAQWVQFPIGEEDALTFGVHGGWPSFTAQLIIAYEPVAQNLHPANWSGVITLMDSTVTALRNAVGTVAKGKLRWSINPTVVTVGSIDYWAVTAEVTGYG